VGGLQLLLDIMGGVFILHLLLLLGIMRGLHFPLWGLHLGLPNFLGLW
jgi:hypothetical protein